MMTLIIIWGMGKMRNYNVESGSGKHKVYLFATVTGDGIMSSIVGGEKPHLGAVVLSLPRKSLADPAVASCTSTILPLLGHKDDEAARPVAEMLAREMSVPVCVSAGVHIDDAGPGDIQILKENCIDCGRKLLDLIR